MDSKRQPTTVSGASTCSEFAFNRSSLGPPDSPWFSLWSTNPPVSMSAQEQPSFSCMLRNSLVSHVRPGIFHSSHCFQAAHPLACLFADHHWDRADGREWGLLCLAVTLTTVTASVLGTFALFRIEMGVLMTLTSLAPLYSLPMSFWLHGEVPTSRSALGACLAVAGVGIFASSRMSS
jgi:drug/metabolite transporter (DMT)-like permease